MYVVLHEYDPFLPRVKGRNPLQPETGRGFWRDFVSEGGKEGGSVS